MFHLGVPKHVTDHIEKTYSGAAAQKREAISWWIENDTTASWRKVAYALLKAGYPLLGTRLMLIGKSFNLILTSVICYCDFISLVCLFTGK